MIIPDRDYTVRERTVCDLLAPLTNVRRLLNVGMRHPGDPRNLWWINICKANGTETHVLEVFEPNCRELRAAGIDNVTCGDVCDVRSIYHKPFDVLLWWHGPEHIEKPEAPGVIDGLWQLTAGTLILGCPLGNDPQGICYGNQHERHLCAWQAEDFIALGFQATVVRDGQPYPHITAWQTRDGVVAEGTGDREQGTVGTGQPAGGSGHDAESGQEPGGRSQEEDGSGQMAVGTQEIADCQLADHDVGPSSLIHHRSSLIAKPQTNDQGQMTKIAIIFDDKTRPETTGIYCRKALKSLVEVEFFHPNDLTGVPRDGFDLYLAIDDGLDYPWPEDLHPCAYWAIDTHMDFERCLRRARQVEFVFAAQQDGAQRLHQTGIRSAQWLPLACDGEIHGRQDVPEQYDVCFVGNLFPGPRTDLVRLIQQYFRRSFVGNGYFEEMARIYSSAKIVFNCSLRNDINMRVFEALASGSLLVTNDLTENGQHTLFRDGVHLVTYRDSDELLDKLRYYLRRDDLRERIAAAGRAEALDKHTYVDRMQRIVDAVQAATLTRSAGEAGRVQAAVGSGQEERAEFGGRGANHEGNGQPVVICHSSLVIGNENAQPMTRDDGPITNSDPQSAIRNPKSPHDLSYFDFARPEILALIPATAATVLEIGCGHGRLGEALKARQPCEVIGVELDQQAAAVARGRLDLVFAGDMEPMDLHLWGGYFDAATCGDVLEHFADPVEQLARIRDWLKADGMLIASIPNVRNHVVVRSLLDGNWTYEPAGILDATHLHFFTRRNIQTMFEEAGFAVLSWSAVPGPGHEEWNRAGRPRNINLGRVQLLDLPEQEAEEFFVYQWLVVAAPAASGGRQPPVDLASRPAATVHRGQFPGVPPTNAQPMTKDNGQRTNSNPQSEIRNPKSLPSCLLLMVTYNRLDYTRLALESVLALDYPNLQIAVFDNASTDGTVAYLEQRIAGERRARLIASPVNRGVVYPMNAVWESDHGAELLAKVDNDTWVPPDLLHRLAECHQRSQRFGVLSGFHFRAEGEALADDSRVSELDGVRVLSQPYVGGCAVMVRREVLDRLGPIPCRNEGQQGPLMDSGWTFYQQRMNDDGLVNGYPWPPIHVDHMEDVRSRRCIRTPEHQQYKQALRGMSLEQFTEELCVWRPHWAQGESGKEKGESEMVIGHSSMVIGAGAPKQMTNDQGQMTNSNPQPKIHNPQSRMRFTHDFVEDFDQFDFRGPPFAFVRFADGERAICTGQPIQGADGWNYAGGSSPFRDALLAALRYTDPDYYVGISDSCCDPEAKAWYLREIALPRSQVTFSNIFVNGNYSRFRQLHLSDAATVASDGGDYWVPADVLNTPFDIDGLVERLLGVKRPILVSAGPASCVIIHRYWLRAPAHQRRVIVDVGSAIDELTKGRKTRQHQVPGTRTAELVCTW